MGTAEMRSDFLVNKFKKFEGINAKISTPPIQQRTAYVEPEKASLLKTIHGKLYTATCFDLCLGEWELRNSSKESLPLI